MKTLFAVVVAAVVGVLLTFASCGLFNGLNSGVTCAGDTCTCDHPLEGEEDAVCDGEGCQCIDGVLTCASSSVECEVRFDDGECFNATCGCETVDGSGECECDKIGQCASLAFGSIVDGAEFGCVGPCSCLQLDSGELCACNRTNDCVLDVEEVQCANNGDCDVMARAEAIGCDHTVPDDLSGCVDDERCLKHPFEDIGLCFLVQDTNCGAIPGSFEEVDQAPYGPLCLRTVVLPTPRCAQGVCGGLPTPDAP